MRNARTYIADIAARLWPVADGACLSAVTRGPNFERDAGLIRTARV